MADIDKKLRDKILKMSDTELRMRFFRPDEGIRVYHMSRGRLLELAVEADAFYKIGRMCLIDKDKFETNLENYKIESLEGTSYEREKYTLVISD